MRIYIACGGRKMSIASVEVVKETDKRFTVDISTQKSIRGWVYIPKNINRSQYNVFYTLIGAQQYCLEEAEHQAERAKQALIAAQAGAESLKAEIAKGGNFA